MLGGDIKYLAPEVVTAFNQFRIIGRGEIVYAMQPAWELGNVMFEMATGVEAWPSYPEAFTYDDAVHVDPRSLRAWLPEEYPREVADVILGLMHPNPERRTPLHEATGLLKTLRRELWGEELTPEHKFPTDESATGQWVAGRSIDGTFAMIPYDSSLPILTLRDNMAARLALGR